MPHRSAQPAVGVSWGDFAPPATPDQECSHKTESLRTEANRKNDHFPPVILSGGRSTGGDPTDFPISLYRAQFERINPGGTFQTSPARPGSSDGILLSSKCGRRPSREKELPLPSGFPQTANRNQFS